MDVVLLKNNQGNSIYPATHSNAIKMAGENKTLAEKMSDLLPPKAIDLSQISEVTGGMINNGKWAPTGNVFNRKGKYVPVKAGSTYKLSCSATANYAFMTTNSIPVANGNLPLVTGCSREEISADTDTYLVAPTGANYIYIQTDYLDSTLREWSISFVPQTIEDVTDAIPLENSDRPVSSKSVFDLKSSIFTEAEVDSSEMTSYTGFFLPAKSSSINWSANAQRGVTFVPLDEEYNYTLMASAATNYGFLTNGNAPNSSNAVPYVDNEDRRDYSSPNVYLNLQIPTGTKFLCVNTKTTAGTITITIKKTPKHISTVIQQEVNDAVSEQGGDFLLLDLSEKPEMAFWLNSSNQWQASSPTSRRYIVASIIPLSTIRLVGGSYSTNYAILQDKVINGNANYATGCSRLTIQPSQVVEIDVPSNGYYLAYMSKNADNNDCSPSVYVRENVGDTARPASLHTMYDVIGRNSQLGQIDLSQYPETSASMGGGTVWQNITDRKSKFIPITAGCWYRITAEVGSTNYAFMKDDDFAIGATLNFASGETRKTLSENGSVVVQAPFDAKFLYVVTFIDTAKTILVECVAPVDLTERKVVSAQAMSTLKNGTVVSMEDYIFAFPPHILFRNGHIQVVFSGNKGTDDGDKTDNNNKFVLADLSLDGTFTNVEMPIINQFVDRNGNAISGITKAYGNCIFTPFGNDVAMFGIMGDAENPGYSWGYKTTWDGTVYTRCHLVYGSTEVEFDSDNYRQMLVDKGWMSSKVAVESIMSDCYAFYKVGNTYYTVMCTFAVHGEKVNLPLVLLSSSDLATWTVVTRLGSNVHNATEIRFVINGGKVYVVYRGMTVSPPVGANDGYGIGIYNLSDGSAIFETEIKSYVISLPMCFLVNGNVWCGFNERASILGTPDSYQYCGDRQQMAFYKFTDTGIEYQFSAENAAGLQYATTTTISKKNSGGNIETNLDRIYMAWSEDRRGRYFRQYANVTVADMTDVFK